MAKPLAHAAGLAGPMQVRCLRGADAMQQVRADWLRLATSSRDRDISFQSFGWCAAWLSAFAGPRCRPLIFIAEQDGRPLALLPMMVQREAGVSRAVGLGDPHMQVANALAVPGPAGVAALAACVDAVERLDDIDTVEIGPVPAASSLALALGPHRLVGDEATALSTFDCTPFADGADYMASLSKNRRRDFRRKIAKLEEIAPVERLFLTPGQDGFGEALAMGLAWKRDWLRATRTVSIALSDARTDAFFDALASAGAGVPRPEVQTLRHGGREIAVALNLVGTAPHGQRACYLCAYDPTFHASSPGTLTHQMGIQRSIEEGLAAYSLLGYPTPFKRTWTDDVLPLLRHEMALTWRGHLWLSGWRNGLRPALRRAVHAASRSTPDRS